MKNTKKPSLGDGIGFDMFGWKTREDRDNDLRSVVSELNNGSTTIDGIFLDAQQHDDDDDDNDNADPLLISRRRRRRRIPRRYRLEIPQQHGHKQQQQQRRRRRIRIVVAAIATFAVVVVLCVLLSIYARQRRHNSTPQEEQEASSSSRSNKGFVFPQHSCPPDTDNSSSQQHEDEEEEWIKIGRLRGFHLFDEFGSSIALNADGTVVAVGAHKYQNSQDPHKERLGRVQAYRYNPQHREWLPLGQALMGQHSGDQLGQSIALSGDGTILVVGVPQKTSSSPKRVMASSSASSSSNSAITGHVRVYRLVQPNQQKHKQHSDAAAATTVAEWVPLGNPIVPQGRDGISLVGYKVSCSYTCGTIALSGIQNLPREGHHHHVHNDNNNIPRRFVQVYRLGEPTATTTLLSPPNDSEEQQQQDWVQMGQTLDGIPAKMALGHFGLSLSADGRHLAFAGRDTTPARVYTYHDHHEIWRREAPDLYLHHDQNNNSNNNNGTTTTFQAVVTALSCNGNIFAAGGGGVLRNGGDGNTPSPPVGVYQLQNTDPNNQEWIPILQADEVLNPQQQQSSSPIRFNHFAGSHAALSDNGRYLVLGDTTHSVDDQHIHAGQMRVLHRIHGEWWRVATTVNGDMRNDAYGETVAISSDGTMVAVSSLRHLSSNPNPMAYVDLFQRTLGGA